MISLTKESLYNYRIDCRIRINSNLLSSPKRKRNSDKDSIFIVKKRLLEPRNIVNLLFIPFEDITIIRR
jgi:hypothetical protein